MAEVRSTGVLLVNLGSPDAPEPRAVRRYLRQFLGDPRVLAMPALARWLLLNAVILPFRPRRSAEAYRAIWTSEGSPLILHSGALCGAVSEALGPDFEVRLAMRYGQPSIEAGLAELEAAGVERVIVLPLFPQYASAVTASVAAEVFACLERQPDIPPLEILGAFYDEPDFAQAWASVAAAGLTEFAPDHVLFSYHGLPESQVRRSDPRGDHCLSSRDCCEAPGASLRRCYRAQCFATTRSLISALALDPLRATSSFQSRLGRTPWIGPHTDRILPELIEGGTRRLAVLCPSFVCDCLETLEEIGLRLREQWMALGGEDLWLAPCPNEDAAMAEAIAGWIRRRAPGPRP
jgi:ferrochelatase